MPHKTRAQKIQSTQRKTLHQTKAAAISPDPSNSPQSQASLTRNNQDSSTPTINNLHTSAFAYVGHDLKHIAWTSLTCLLLLAIAALFLSDFSWIQNARQALHLPTLDF